MARQTLAPPLTCDDPGGDPLIVPLETEEVLALPPNLGRRKVREGPSDAPWSP